MGNQKDWNELYEEASQAMRRWRREHKRATLTEIEETVDEELARIRAQMIQDLAMSSEAAEIRSLPKEDRPKCPQCGRPAMANGRQKRQLATDHEQVVELNRSKAYCRHCKLSFFPSG